MAKKTHKTLIDLQERSKKIHTYHSILSLLHWDQETYMPEGGITPRSEQIALLSSLIHEEKTSVSFKNCLEKLIHLGSGKPKIQGLSLMEKAMLREYHRDFLRATKLPAAFVKNFSQVTSEASQVWATAKKQNNFQLFAPFLTKIVELAREKAKIFGFIDHPYDALLETYEPCMTTKKLDAIFSTLKKEIVSILRHRKQKPCKNLHMKVGADTQEALGKWFVSQMPMESCFTRLDLSSHPFSMALHPHDSRITTRVLPNNFMSNIFSILHEMGHSLYEMGLPLEYWGTPLGEPVSLTVHESQSRFWETCIGRCLPFWEHFYPLLKKQIPKILKNISLTQFYGAINHAEPSFIRVEADELTYCLHVILRFEIEKKLISGELQVVDLPREWNKQMKELLGICPPNDALGCLQDIHWSLGEFGYFPTYALGNLMAAQLFATFTKTHPNWEDEMASGNLQFVREWLKKQVHQRGKLYDMEKLTKKVTGHPFSEKAYCAYLRKKYA
jgi:carboxypeptidase Taq